MANPLYNMLNVQQPKNIGNNNIFSAFQSFMQKMQGKNPHDIIQNMINTHQISQEQLNQLQGQARQMMGQFEGFKNMFGFK